MQEMDTYVQQNPGLENCKPNKNERHIFSIKLCIC